MSKYLAPLGIFVTGHLFMLVALLILSSIGTAGEQLAEDTAEISSVFWNWGWAVSGVRLWVFLALEFGVLFATAKALIKTR